MNTLWRWRNHGSGWVINLLWEYLLCLMLDYLLGMPWNKTPSYKWMLVWGDWNSSSQNILNMLWRVTHRVNESTL